METYLPGLFSRDCKQVSKLHDAGLCGGYFIGSRINNVEQISYNSIMRYSLLVTRLASLYHLDMGSSILAILKHETAIQKTFQRDRSNLRSSVILICANLREISRNAEYGVLVK